jgi:multidrug efflux system membrane fusion protein
MRHALFLALAGITALAACAKTEPAADPVRAVRTMTVSPQTAGGTYEYAGEIRARIESRLSFRVGGKMLKRMVDLGDIVKAGQLLAQLDAQDLRLGEEAARAGVAAAQASFDQNAADYQRYRDLSDKGFIGPAELDRRNMALKTARAQLDQAKAQSLVQGNQAGYAGLIADASGVITGVDLEPGMMALAGTPVVRLAHDGPRDVVFAVPEDKVSLVKATATQPGRFKVRLWGANGALLPATIREISAAADPTTRTFMIKADIGSASANGVRLGQTATVQMELPQIAGITKLPLSALREQQGRSAVWLVDRESMTIKSQEVVLAGADGNDAVISAGLKPGEIVVTAGVHVLNPGQKVKFYVDPGAPPVAAVPAVSNVNASVSVK